MSESEQTETPETDNLSPEESAEMVNQGLVSDRIEETPTEPGIGTNSTLDELLSRFKNTEPHTPIDELDVPTQLEQNWKKYMFRGLGKFLKTDMRASAFDLVAGFYGMTKSIFTPTDELHGTEEIEESTNIPGDNEVL